MPATIPHTQCLSVKTSAQDTAVSSLVVILATPLAGDREYLRSVLERHRGRAIEAATLREALSAIGTFGANTVFCDETLPWRDVLSYIAEQCDPPRLVVVADGPTALLCAEVMNLGGLDVLAKPFSLDEVEWVLGLVCSTVHPPRRMPASERKTARAARGQSA